MADVSSPSVTAKPPQLAQRIALIKRLMFGADSTRARITRGIVIAVTAGTVLGLVGIARGISNLRNLEIKTYANLATAAQRRLEARVETDRSRVRVVGGSKRLYSALEVADDTVLSREQLLQLTANTGVRFVGLYDSEGNHLYRWSSGNRELGPAIPINAISRMLYGRQPIAGVVTTESGPLWVAGAPVVPSDDDAAPILGYLIVAQPFTAAMFTAGTDNAELLMADDPKGFETRVDPNENGDSIVVKFGITDLYAQQPLVAAVSESRYWFRHAERSFWVLAWLTVMFGALVAWLGVRFGYQWIVQPTVRLNDALTTATRAAVPTLLPPVADDREWKSIVASANRLITKIRQAAERFDRLLGASADATWERDLVSGEWSGSPAFYRLLEIEPERFPTPTAVFDARLRSENRQQILEWLGAHPAPAEPISLETAIARPGSVELPIRFEASAVSDSSGALTRIQGRLIDVSAERKARETLEAAATTAAASSIATGEFLSRLGRLLAESPSSVNPRHIQILGLALADQNIEIRADTFDLYQLLQEVAGTDNELLIVPGLPQYVSGDPKLLRDLLEALRGDFTGRIVIRGMAESGKQSGGLRLSIEGQLGPVDIEYRQDPSQRLVAPAHGELRWDVSRAIVEALDGSLEIKPDGKRAVVTAKLVMPTAPSPALADLPDPATNGDWRADESVTFVQDTPPLEAPAEDPASKAEAAPPTLELIADTTITVDLDAISPRETVSAPVIGETFLAELRRGSAPAEKAVKMALAEMPARMAELMGAARGKELGPMATSCAAIQRLAELIEAEEIRELCLELIKAIEKGYLESHTRAVEPIRQGWSRVRETLASLANPSSNGAQHPAIEPETMKQLIAERAAGLGAHLVTMFLSDVPPRIEALTKALRAGNHDQAAAEASQLKGMCSLVGARHLADLCEAARLTPSEASTTALRHEWDRVHRALGELAAVRSST